MQKDDSKKSIVGDPVFWPGLIYAPINVSGLVFALGSISSITGLIFEEFSQSGRTAVCRRRTEQGWERIKVALTVKSSDYQETDHDVDLLICWADDSDRDNGPPVMELRAIGRPIETRLEEKASDGVGQGRGDSSKVAENDDSEDAEYGEFEETIRLLDEKIRKFKGG